MIFNSQIPAEPTPSTIERLEALVELTRKAADEAAEIFYIHGNQGDCGAFTAYQALIAAHKALVEAVEARKAYVAEESRKHQLREKILAEKQGK
jgi:hypothetical protein